MKRSVPQNWKIAEFRDLYKMFTYSIVSNLHPESPVGNSRLLERYIGGEFDEKTLAKMTPYEMFPENWKELADKQLIREQKILEGNKSRATSEYTCKHCKKSECAYYEMQTRSADEPITRFISCLNCGKRWRENN
jgi:transcription elongation factor S-II